VVLISIIWSGALVPFSAAQPQDIIDVPVGYSEVWTPARVPESVIVGNPDIADVTIANQTIILTAKAVGLTNLIVLDEAGNEMRRATVQVVPIDVRPQFIVRVIEGGSKGDGTRGDGTRYLCGPAPGCVSIADDENDAITPPVRDESEDSAGVTEESSSAAEPDQ
jgi:hypothetical protein